MDADLFTFTCPNCGTKVEENATPGTVVSCTSCGLAFRLSKSLTPQPSFGPLITKADFTNSNVPGWKVLNRNKLVFSSNDVPELQAVFPPSDLYHPILRTYSPFDNLDVGVTISFLEGKYTHVHAGLEIRSGDDGDYVISLSPQGTYRIGWHQKKEWGGEIWNWSDHPVMLKNWGDANRLRVIANGKHINVWINNVFAASVKDDRFTSGLVRLVLAPKMEKTVAAFSKLELRDLSLNVRRTP